MPTATDKPRVGKHRHVHRDLRLVSPLLTGPDVHAFQDSLNGLFDHYEFNRQIQADGDYGKRTRREAAFMARAMGLDQKRIDTISARAGLLTEPVQHVIRNPEDRSQEDREREDKRRQWRRDVREREHSIEAAVDWMIDQVGTKEQPDFSNHGPFPIDACQAHFGLSGEPWCGCVVGFAIEKIAGIETDIWWPHAGSIRADAIAGRNGLIDINPANATKGCIATFFNGGDDHVAFIRAATRGGVLFTVEGNTSSAKQSSDGGIIEVKERSVSEMTCCAKLTIA